MLELIQQRFQTVVLVILVFLLVGVFATQFGGRQADGCTTSVNQTGYAARVYDTTILEGDFRAAFTVTGFNRYPTESARQLHLRELTLDGLIERELLAHEAETLGFTADTETVLREFAETAVIRITPPVDAPFGYPGPDLTIEAIRDDDGNFSLTRMQRFVNNGLRRSTDEFARWQTRERLADLMRSTVLSEVAVSSREIRDQYVRETERATIRYAAFSPDFYETDLAPTDEEIRTWMESHTAEVDAEYERQAFNYRDLEPQVRLRHILISAAEDAPEEERAAARTRAEAVRARLLAGEDFATVARETTEDPGSRDNGGLYDWSPRGRYVPPFEEAAFSQEIGAIGELVETRFGYHIIRVEGRREGDVPEDEAKRELAQNLYLADRAGTAAREEATRALAFLREGHTMDELDERLLHRWADVPPPAAPGEGEAAVPAEGAEAAAEAAAEETERPEGAPQVVESRSFGRTESPIVGAGSTGALTRAAYELTMDEPLPAEPIQVGTDFYVIELTARTEATDEGFTDEVRDRIYRSLLEEKRTETLRVYVHALRARAEEAGAIRIDQSVLRYGDEVEEEEEEGEDEGEAESDDEASDDEGESEGGEGEDGESEDEEGGHESAIVRERSSVPA